MGKEEGRFCGKMLSGPAEPWQEGNSRTRDGHQREGSAVTGSGDCTNNPGVPRDPLLRSLFFALNFAAEGSNS